MMLHVCYMSGQHITWLNPFAHGQLSHIMLEGYMFFLIIDFRGIQLVDTITCMFDVVQQSLLGHPRSGITDSSHNNTFLSSLYYDLYN